MFLDADPVFILWNSVHSPENKLLKQFFASRGCGRIWQARFVFIGCFCNSVHSPENELLEQFFAFRSCGRIWQARFVFIGCFWNPVHSPENELLEQFFAFRSCGRIWQARFLLIAMTADRTRARTRTGPDPTRTRAPDPDRTGRTLIIIYQHLISFYCIIHIHSYCIISYAIIACCIISSHIAAYHLISLHIAAYHTILHYVLWYYLWQFISAVSIEKSRHPQFRRKIPTVYTYSTDRQPTFHCSQAIGKIMQNLNVNPNSKPTFSTNPQQLR